MKKIIIMVLFTSMLLLFGCKKAEKIDVANDLNQDIDIQINFGNGREGGPPSAEEGNLAIQEMILNLNKNSKFKSYFKDKGLELIDLGIDGGGELTGNIRQYKFIINNNINNLLLMRVSGKYDIVQVAGYESNCDKGNPYYKEVSDGNGQTGFTCDGDIGEYREDLMVQEFVPVDILDVVIEDSNIQTLIMGENFERVEMVKRGPE